MTETTGQYPPKTCKRLDALHEQRRFSIVRETELVNTRKALRGELLDLGPGETDEHKSLALDMWRTLCEIEYQRDRIKTLADKIDETIANAHQLTLHDEDDDKISPAKPSDKTLFDTLAKKQPREESREHKPGEKTPDEIEGAVPEGEDQHLDVSVNELDMPEQIKGKCIKAGYMKIAALATIMDASKDLHELLDLDGGQVAELSKAFKVYVKAHRKAKEGKFKGEPNGPRTDYRKKNSDKKHIGTGAKKTSRK